MRGLFKFIAGLFVTGAIMFADAPARADIATVKYLHDYIKQRWTLDIPMTAGGVFDMKYLMHTVDISNNLLNGNPTSYATDASRATTHVVATTASDKAVENLIKPEFKFFFTPATDENTYTFEISAAGVYYIDWDDGGKIETIQKDTLELEPISHTFADGKPASAHEIKLAGRASKYSTGTTTAAVRFYDGNYYDNTTEANQDKPPYVNPYQLKSMRGCLGCVFATVTDETVAGNMRQPRFYYTFRHNKTLTSEIPAELFNGVTGAPASYMFYGTFQAASGLNGSIPGNLFAGISGAPSTYMFAYLFSGCSGLTGTIPANIFAGINGKPAQAMFIYTFNGASGLTGEIPGNLFAGIKGAPATNMFSYTFQNCSGLNSIGGALFAGISGAPASSMFSDTFNGCKGLTGKIPVGLFGDIYGDAAISIFSETFSGCSKLEGPIPSGLFGRLTGAPKAYMFYRTFYNCSNLTGEIPSGLFGELSGAPATSMFHHTFAACGKLTGSIPDKLFIGISGKPASLMYYQTFYNCKGLTGDMPENLFGDIAGEAVTGMFQQTFGYCSGLTGPSAKVGKPGEREYLYERWPDTVNDCTQTNASGWCTTWWGPSYNCYTGVTGLTDWADIPTNWGGPKVVE